MDSSLDSIWDEPVVEASPKRTNDIDGADDENANLPRPAKRPRTSLFFSDSEDEVGVSGPSRKATHKAPPVQEVDIDALFADFDDDEEALKPLPPTIDEEEMTRQAEARHRRNMPPLTPHEIMPSSSPQRDTGNSTGNKRSGDQEQGKDEKKARRRIVKLDENRLLGPNGFPHLIKMTKDFRIKGKGHEATDLSRILQIYQYWTHELYPKTQFLDTVERVEKLCHSRRMNVSLSVWRDEAHG
ncbi:replication fork protection component Swi3-domain-containing protein, partial [Flammula alnicola]